MYPPLVSQCCNGLTLVIFVQFYIGTVKVLSTFVSLFFLIDETIGTYLVAFKN